MPSPEVCNLLLSLPGEKQFEAGSFDLDELVEKLTGALVHELQRNEIQSLTGDDGVLVVECLDKVISSPTFRTKDIDARSKVFSTISRLSRRCQYLPRSYWIDPQTIELPGNAYTSGTCAQVYKGKQNGKHVAVKILRTSIQEDSMTLRKRFCKEAILWKHVSCPYVLKFHGVFYHEGLPAIVTPWISHGNIMEYLKKHPDADRLRLLLCVVKGVTYLHSCNIAHGDIKGPNVLVSDSTPPMTMLADLGFTRVTTISVKKSSNEEGTFAFMSPELLLPEQFGLEKGVPSKEADVYALGMTVYQVLTDKWPFFPKRETEILTAVVSGERPPKPEDAEGIGMTEDLWNLLQECWKEDPRVRPGISEIMRTFRSITGEGTTTDYTTGAALPRLDNAGKRDSVDSRGSLITRLSSRGSDMDRQSSLDTTLTSTRSYDVLNREDICEAKEKHPPEEQPTIQTSNSAMPNLATNMPDVRESLAGPTFPYKTGQRASIVRAKGRKIFGWAGHIIPTRVSNTPRLSTSLDDRSGQEGISEANGRGPPEVEQPTTRLSDSTKPELAINKSGVGRPPMGHGSPTDIDRCIAEGFSKGKGKRFGWRRSKQKDAIVRSESL